MFEITPVDPYTSDDLNWTDDNSRVSVEHNDESNCFKASVCIFEYKINLCSEQNPYAFCILGIYIYVAPPRTSFQYDFANDKKEKATLTKSEDCFQNNIHTHFCIRNLRIIQTGYSILPVPEKSVFPPWR